MRRQVAFPVVLLASGLLFMGLLRLAAFQPGFLTPFAGLATPGYVLLTVFLTIWLVRSRLPLGRFGFQAPPLRYLAILVIIAIVVLRAADLFLNPLIEEILGGPRNLERYASVEGSVGALAGLLALNWTFAAFGKEFAYRIVLMRGLAFTMGDSRHAQLNTMPYSAMSSSSVDISAEYLSRFGVGGIYRRTSGRAGRVLTRRRHRPCSHSRK